MRYSKGGGKVPQAARGVWLSLALAASFWSAVAWAALPEDLRLSLAWKPSDPERTTSLGELREQIAALRLRREALRREIVALRGIKPDTPAIQQLEKLLRTAAWHAETEAHIRYLYNKEVERPGQEEPTFRPFTERQQRIIELGDVIDEAYSLRSQENLLTALAEASRRATTIEGYYTDFRTGELVVTRVKRGYRVLIGGAYGLSTSLHAYGYDYVASRKGDDLTGKARLMYAGLKDAPETVVIRFDRGLAVTEVRGQLAYRTYVKLAELRDPQKPLDRYMTIGAGPSSPDNWEARKQFLGTALDWTTAARPFFIWDAYHIYDVCDKALGESSGKR